MSQRTKIIVFVAIILAIVIIFGVGIGVKQGWFAGLADVIRPQATPEAFTADLYVKAGITPVPGVSVIITRPQDFDRTNAVCEPNRPAEDSPIGRQGQSEFIMTDRVTGSSVTDSEGKMSFNVGNGSGEFYLRLKKDSAQKISCAFHVGNLTAEPNRSGIGFFGIDPTFSPHVIKFRDIPGGKNLIINYSTSPENGGGGSGSISGTVNYLDGTHIVGASLSLYNADNTPYRLNGATTNGDGFYKFDNVPNGSYKVGVQSKPCDHVQGDPTAVTVSAAQPDPTLNFNLAREDVPADSAKIYGKITDTQNSPLDKAQVRLYSPPTSSTPSDSTESDNQGNYSFCPVTIGQNYKVSASKQDYLSAEETIQNLAAGPKKVDLKLSPVVTNATFNLSGTIKGRSDCNSEQNLPGVNVAVVDAGNNPVRKADNTPATATTDNNGAYSIERISLVDSQGRTAAKIRIDSNYYYTGQDFSFTPQANQNIVVNGTLNGKNLKASISGQVKENKSPVAGAKIYLISGTENTKIADSDVQGNYQNNNLSPDYIGREVTIKAEIERNGQNYSGARTITLQCQNTVDLIIKVKPDKATPDQITIELGLSEQLSFKDFNPHDQFRGLNAYERAKAIYIWNMICSADGNKHAFFQEIFNQAEDIFGKLLGYLYQGRRVINEILPQMYEEHFGELDQWGGLSENLLRQYLPAYLNPYGLEYKFDIIYNLTKLMQGLAKKLSNESKPEKCPFKKINIPIYRNGSLTRNQLNRIEWEINHANINDPAINWGDLNALGRRGKENKNNTYTITVDVPDDWLQKTTDQRKEWIKNLVERLNLSINPIGSSIVTYNLKSVSIDKKNVYSYLAHILFGVSMDNNEGKNFLKSVDNSVKIRKKAPVKKGTKKQATIENGGLIANDLGLRMVNTDNNQPLGDFLLQDNTFFSALDPGNYRFSTIMPRNTLYVIDPRADTVSINSEGIFREIDLNLCYTPSSAYLSAGRFKYLGEESPILSSYFSRAGREESDFLNKAGVDNLVYAGNMDSRANYNLSEPMQFCRVENNNAQDISLNGRSVVIADKFISAVMIKNNNSALAINRDIKAMIDYQTGDLYYHHGLSSVSQQSWTNIMQASESSGQSSAIYSALSEASMIKDYLGNDSDSVDSGTYGFATAALANPSLLDQRKEDLNDKAKYTLMAMAWYANKIKNGSDLYPVQVDLTTTVLSPENIMNGSWLASTYQGMSASKKVSLKLTKFGATIKSSKIANQISQSWMNLTDAILGTKNTGIVTGIVTLGDQPLKNATVTIGDKTAKTNNSGRFEIKRIPLGEKSITVKDAKSNKDYGLLDSEQSVKVEKNKTKTIIIRLVE